MVEEAQCGEGARATPAAQKLRIEEQRWLEGYIRSVQGLDFESYNPSYKGDDFRCSSEAVLESAQGVGLNGWAANASGPSAADEAWAESSILASIPEFTEYNDTEVDK